MKAANQVDDQLSEKRRALVLRFCDLPDKGSPLSFQRDLAAELRATETRSTQSLTQELSRHKRLVRIIGDSLAFSVLDQHTIRTLSRHPGPSPSIVGQREDFAHVSNIAEMLAASGYVPLLCDVTNLLKVGDIVAVAEDHVLVLECKRSPLPSRLPGNGRLARQRLRGTQAAEYLRRSQIAESDGVRQALPVDLPEPCWHALTDLASRVSTLSGSAIAMLDDGDAVALAIVGDSLENVTEIIEELNHAVAANSPVFGTQLDILESPRWNCPPPLVFPVQPLLRHALLEGNALMFRLIDSDRFLGPRNTASGRLVELRVTCTTAKAKLSLIADNQPYELGPWFLDRVMHTPTTVVGTRDALLSCADALLTPTAVIAAGPDEARPAPSSGEARPQTQSIHEQVSLAKGNDVAYGTVYTGLNGDGQAVVYEVPSEDNPGRFHIAWDPEKRETAAVFVDGIRRNWPI